MPLRKTSLEIDEALFNGVRVVLNTTTLRETVEQAFLHVLRNAARREEIEALSNMRGMDLNRSRVMSRAWRT